jgi:glycerophosphoryl diester phosphodiesterase
MIKRNLFRLAIISALTIAFQIQAYAIDVIAHRGASGEYPQGTWLAFHMALEQGADALELDVHLSKDNQIIINHDADLKKNVGISDKIQDLTLGDIKLLDAGHELTLDDGATFPFRGQGITLLTLNELFDYFPNEQFSIEIKANSKELSEQVWMVINEYGIQDQTVVASQHSKAMKHFRKISNGSIKTSATVAELVGASFAWGTGWGWAYKPKFDVAQIPFDITTKPYVKFFQKKGVRVDVWTVNEPNQIERAINMGVDGIIGDYPARIHEALQDHHER